MAAWRYEIFQHSKRNFVSLRGHVISSICMDNLWSKGTHTSEPKHFQQCEFPPPPPPNFQVTAMQENTVSENFTSTETCVLEVTCTCVHVGKK